ncbi:MAG: Porphobilinogen deaminase [Pseudolabrys sp.]|jgi:hydroxymethylbilane synthase|nr:Porphobilinogen deaminase [Pseudolabrys sp.]
MAPWLRIGTRGSPLAMYQAHAVRDRLAAAHGIAPDDIAIAVIRTTGDRIQDRPLADAGGKGLFTKEIEEALLAGAIDLAVHSAKDVPSLMPPGLRLAAYLEREDVRDAFLSRKAASLAALPRGASLGTSSPRRQAIALRLRPDLRIVPLRGNVETRLRKLEQGEADATILAVAGLKRLGLGHHATRVMSEAEFLPAGGQGAIAIETRADDDSTNERLARIDHADTAAAVTLERAFLAVLDGTCKTPIAAHATVDGDSIAFRGLIATPDGRAAHEIERQGRRGDAERIGTAAGQEIKRRARPEFFPD